MRHFLSALLICFAGYATAQSNSENNQLGLLLGAEFISQHNTATPPPAAIRFRASEAYQLNFAHRLTGDDTQLWIEVPSVAGPSHRIRSSNAATPVNLATFFATPSFRLNWRAQRRFSPWLSFGGGYALYEGSERLRDGSANLSRFVNTAALQFGAGVDVKTRLKIWRPIGFRGEVRDFYSLDTPRFTTPVRDDRQHNVVVSGGFIVRF